MVELGLSRNQECLFHSFWYHLLIGYNEFTPKLPNEFSLEFQRNQDCYVQSNNFKYDLLMNYNEFTPKLPHEFSLEFHNKSRVFNLIILYMT